MLDWLVKRLGKRQQHSTSPPTFRVILTQGCLDGMTECLCPDRERGHEGIAYLLGHTDGASTVAIAAIRPESWTTRGSFDVNAVAMARIVRVAANLSLQVVGQVHTHPGEAYHSDGDIAGARIRYPGYISIVLPQYGQLLPKLEGAANYIYARDRGFVHLEPNDVLVVPGRLE